MKTNDKITKKHLKAYQNLQYKIKAVVKGKCIILFISKREVKNKGL